MTLTQNELSIVAKALQNYGNCPYDQTMVEECWAILKKINTLRDGGQWYSGKLKV